MGIQSLSCETGATRVDVTPCVAGGCADGGRASAFVGWACGFDGHLLPAPEVRVALEAEPSPWRRLRRGMERRETIAKLQRRRVGRRVRRRWGIGSLGGWSKGRALGCSKRRDERGNEWLQSTHLLLRCRQETQGLRGFDPLEEQV